MTNRRLIEESFPLKQASIDSVHEKNVRHGHISTLHIWPARRPLAACRAAIIASLVQDPDDPDVRTDLLHRIGGEVVERDGDFVTDGGILHWGNENGPEMDGFRQIIRAAFGRAPRVLDMFAGGGAIPLEAMRLGCDVTAIDYNPVAWFILKCTLEYPQRLSGTKWPLPSDVAGINLLTQENVELAEHVRYWGSWVLKRVQDDLQHLYPVLPLDPGVAPSADNPLCPTVAYLWARTVAHPDPAKNGLRVPLIKTLWLCKKPKKKRALRLRYDAAKNRFLYEVFLPASDSEVGAPTMSRKGVQCPPTREGETGTFIPMEYVQRCGKEGDLGAVCTAVVVAVPAKRHGSRAPSRKEYRLPTAAELAAAETACESLGNISREIPFGLPDEATPKSGSGASRAFTIDAYGLDRWSKVFTPRQLLSLATLVKHIRASRDAATQAYMNLPAAEKGILCEALLAYLAVALDRLADYSSSIAIWVNIGECMGHTFSRFALPITWDFAECNLFGDTTGGMNGACDWIARVVEHLCKAATSISVEVLQQSADQHLGDECYDLIITDPPYYDAIPYSELSDFFYVWLRRAVGDSYASAFSTELVPKTSELIQRSDRADQSKDAKKAYEDGMGRAFQRACDALAPNGRMVVVFAHKQPDAWETLVAAMIRSGFVVTASWPIDTERAIRLRSIDSAALSSSVWLVCRKRPTNAGKGWYKQVQARMRERITERLRYFWDQGIRGPDFLWSAVGPGLESFSAYDEVRRNDGSPVTVSEFLKEVRRITTDFALGQIVEGGTEGLDEWTRYALMHHQNFAMAGAPVGECILLSGAYGLNLGDLTGPRGILTKGKSKPAPSAEGEEVETEATGSGSELRLLRWDERLRDDLGEPHLSFGIRYIDMLHRLLREWASGDVSRVADYAERQGLGQNDLFWRVAQAFAEMSPLQSRERGLLEAVISWGRGRGGAGSPSPTTEAAQLPLGL